MLKNLFIHITRQYLFWMLFFFICRCIFLIYNIGELHGIPFKEIIATFGHSLSLDTSFACYFLAFSFLVFTLYAIIPLKVFQAIHSVYVILLLLLFSLITIAELEIYKEWGTKLSTKALKYLQNPSEVVHSTSVSFLILGFSAVGLLVVGAYYLWKKICPPLATIHASIKPVLWKKIGGIVVFVATIPVLLIIGLRGGLQQIPIQQSDAYFSKYNILNLAAVNSGWNLAQSMWDNKRTMGKNPYIYYSQAEARKTVDELYKVQKDTTVSILKTTKPNVVLIILEGWSADLVKSLGGYDSVTPGLDKIISEGVLFEHTYASGSLSDQGMAAIFSAFPAQPNVSIIFQPGKYVHLPCINTQFHQAGYTTSFLFGGQLSYGNIKAYMYYNKFDKILEGSDFDNSIPRGRLGVHDEFLYQRQLQELKNEKQPFFAAMFTMSSHNPYDMPMKKEDRLNFNSDEADYANSVHYADAKLYDFLQNAKKEKWFDNTLFVIISDHGHRSPKHWEHDRPEYRRTPFVLWGNVLKDEYKGYRYTKVCSQIDLASTLLHQLNLPATEYEWSKNLFNPYTPEFAYYETNNGFGWVRPDEYFVYSNQTNQPDFEKVKSPEEKTRLEKEGKSFLQTMFQEYTDY